MIVLEALRRLARRSAALQPVAAVEDDLDASSAESARRAMDAREELEAAEHFDTLDYADGERDGRLD